MADEITKIIKIESSGSEQTVKGLKKEIESLRDALLNTEKGSEEYKKILEQLINDQKRLADAMNAGKNEVSAATGSYNALKVEMSALKKVWAEVTDEASRGEIGKRIDEINTELKEMDASIGNFQRNVGNYASGFKNARQELAALKTAMDNLEEGSEEYNAAFSRAADISHTLQERQEMLKYSAADVGTQLSNVVSIGSSLVAGFNSINAVIALTGEKSEDLQKVMVKLQAGIALVQGLQGLEGMAKRMKGLLDGTTALIFGVKETTTAVAAETKAMTGNAKAVGAETTAVATNTAAQTANAAATGAATVATKAFQKALIATGIGAIVVLLGTLIAHWEDLKKIVVDSVGGLDRFNGIMDKIKTTIAGVSNVIFNVFIASIKNTITAFVTLGKVMKDVFTFNFSQLAEDVKTGFAAIAENTKNGYDIIGNYQEGAAKKAAEIQEKRTQEALKASAEELNETIKDNEAKYGSDWKYTQDAKKLYDQYFEKLLASYKKDSKEYREAQREKWSYDREYQEHLDKASEAQVKQAQTKANKELESIATIQKRAQDAAKDEVQLLTEKYNEEKALLEKYGEDTTALTAEYEKALTAIFDKIEKRLQNDTFEEIKLMESKYQEEKALLEQSGQDTAELTAEYEKNRQAAIDRIAHSQKYAIGQELKQLEDKYKEEKDLLEKNGRDTAALTAEYEAKREAVIDKHTKSIFDRASDSQKTEIQILTEKYQREKELLEQYGKDVVNLTKEYEAQVAKIRGEQEKNNMEARLTALDDQYQDQVTKITLEYSWKEAKNSGALSYNDIIAETNKIYEANKEYLQAQAEEYKTLMDNVDVDDATRLEAKRNYYNTLANLENLHTQNVIDNTNLQREAIQNQIEMYRELGDAIADIFGSVADILEEDIKNKVKNGQITQEEGEKQFENVKALQIAQATIQTISGAIAAFMGCQSLGQPWGAIIGAVQAAAVTAAGVAQIAKIKNTQLGSNSSVSGGMAAAPVQTVPEEYTPQYTANATGESEITNLADSIHNLQVYVVESDITEAQNRHKVRVTESTW